MSVKRRKRIHELYQEEKEDTGMLDTIINLATLGFGSAAAGYVVADFVGEQRYPPIVLIDKDASPREIKIAEDLGLL